MTIDPPPAVACAAAAAGVADAPNLLRRARTEGTLVIAQAALARGIAFALIPLILLIRRNDLMGSIVNRRSTTGLAGAIAAVIVSLNVSLIYDAPLA